MDGTKIDSVFPIITTISIVFCSINSVFPIVLSNYNYFSISIVFIVFLNCFVISMVFQINCHIYVNKFVF